MAGGEIHLRPLTEADLPAIQALLDRLAAHAEQAPRPGDAERLFRMVPRGASAHDKVMVGLFDPTDRLIGFADLIRHFPAPGTWFIGWMTVDAALRGRGFGEEMFLALDAWARSEGALRWRLGVEGANAGACRFWFRRGFERVAPHARETEQMDALDQDDEAYMMLERPVGDVEAGPLG